MFDQPVNASCVYQEIDWTQMFLHLFKCMLNILLFSNITAKCQVVSYETKLNQSCL